MYKPEITRQETLSYLIKLLPDMADFLNKQSRIELIKIAENFGNKYVNGKWMRTTNIQKRYRF